MLFESAGRYTVDQGGPSPLTWAELSAWRELQGGSVSLEDVRIVHEMSEHFCAGYFSERCPFHPVIYEIILAGAIHVEALENDH
jgi:hypothetical protein